MLATRPVDPDELTMGGYEYTAMTLNSTIPLTTDTSDLHHATPRQCPTLTLRSRLNDDAAACNLDPGCESPILKSQTPTSSSSSKSSPLNVSYSSPTTKGSPRHCSAPMAVPERRSSLRQPRRKKGSSVLGFLALKEPSISALEEFAEQERTRAIKKSGRSAAVMMPGVSSQKLPDHVPKVNSKWDGLPPMIKKKDKERSRGTRSSTLSMSSYGSSSYTRATFSSQEKAGSPRRGTFLDPPSPTLDFNNGAFLSTPSPPHFSSTHLSSDQTRHDSATTSPSASTSASHTANTSWFSDTDDPETKPSVALFDAPTATHPSQRHVTYTDCPSARSGFSRPPAQTYSKPKSVSTMSSGSDVLPSYPLKPRAGSTTSSASGVLRVQPDRTESSTLQRVHGEDVRVLKGVQTEDEMKTARLRNGAGLKAMRQADVLPWEMFEPPGPGEGLMSAASSIGPGGRQAGAGVFVSHRQDVRGGRLKRLGRTFGRK